MIGQIGIGRAAVKRDGGIDVLARGTCVDADRGIRAEGLAKAGQLVRIALPHREGEREKTAVTVAHAQSLRTAARGEVFAGRREDLFDPGLLTERERIWIGSKNAEKRFEKPPLAWLAGSLDLAAAIGVIARGQLLPRRRIAGGIPASLVLGKVRLHLSNLRVEARALRRRRIEQKELAPVAAKRTRGSDRAIEFGALFLGGAAVVVRISLAACAERGDPRR